MSRSEALPEFPDQTPKVGYVERWRGVPPNRTAIGGDDGCIFGPACLQKDGENRARFGGWILFTVKQFERDQLKVNYNARRNLIDQEQNRAHPIWSIVSECNRCFGDFNQIVDKYLETDQ